MKILSIIRSLLALPAAFLTWVKETEVEPENNGEPLPPIRYDGDPKDIYLA